jgi:hypothetical protein
MSFSGSKCEILYLTGLNQKLNHTYYISPRTTWGCIFRNLLDSFSKKYEIKQLNAPKFFFSFARVKKIFQKKQRQRL